MDKYRIFNKCQFSSFKGHVDDLFRFITFYVYYAFVIIQLGLTFKADTLPREKVIGKVSL